MYFSLEDVISCPPPLTSSRSEKPANENTQAKTTEASGFSGMKRGTLSGWCERPSIQTFINAVSSLSLKKKQQQLHEEKQKHEQLQYQIHQIQQQKLHQFQQQQNNPVGKPNSSTNSSCGDQLQLTGFLKETTSASQPQNDAQVPESSQRRPKVRKVMKGGVLVSIPSTTRQPSAGDRCMENTNNSEKNPLPLKVNKDKVNNFCAGNILDDILARAKNNNKQENLHSTVNKTLKKTVNMVKNSSVNSSDVTPLSNEKMNETCKKPVYSAEDLVLSCISEQFSPKVAEEKRSETDYDTKQNECTKSDGKNKEVTADSLHKSINIEASKVHLFKHEATDASGKEDMSISNKLVVPLSTIFGGKTKEQIVELKTSPTTVEDKAAHASCTSVQKFSQAEKKVTKQQTEMIGDMCEASLAGRHESDSSIGSGELFIDLGPVGNEGKKPILRRSKRFTSSESSNDLEIPSSFDRIRALQCDDDDDDVFTNEAETSCETNVVKQSGVQSAGSPEKDEKSLREVQETLLDHGRIKSNQRLNEKQQYKEDFSEKHTVITDTRTTAEKTSTDCINAQTKVLNDDVLPEVLMVQTQSVESIKMDDKIEELNENERKRKELMDEMSSSIETKRKRVKRTIKKEEVLSTPSPIQTKRKGSCKKIIRTLDENYQRVTRSQTMSGKSPNDTTTQDNLVSICSQRDTVDIEKQEPTPTLLSMVSNELWDITVVDKELLNKKSSAGKKKKKKRNKPTEWYLRKMQQERELKNNTKPLQKEYIPPVCIFFSKGSCAQGNLCKFRHEKTRELCSYYARSGYCYKFKDGMCPNLHDEFPCRFFHIKKFCWNEDDCRFSHEVLTDETRGILDNHLLTLQQRQKLLEGDATVLESNSSVPETSENRNNDQLKKMTLCSTDETGGCFSSTSVPVQSPSFVYDQSLDTNTHTVPSEISSQLTNSPKVKRLCYLSSYKPQSLNPDEMNADEMSTSKTTSSFLPGIFKER